MRPSRSFRSVPGVLALFLALSLGACASGGGSEAESGPRRSSNRLTTEELETVSQFDLYTAVSRLRPQWLRSGSRGTLPGVILNGSPQPGGVEFLRNLRAGEVTGLQFMSAADATTRYGTGYPSGAILVTTGR